MSGAQRAVRVLLLAAALASGGCATGGADMSYPDVALDAPDLRDPADGALLGRAAVLARLDAVRVVYVAEQHADPASHAVQRATLDLLAETGRALVIAVEWLPASAGSAVDAWLAGDAPPAALATAVDWERRWGHAFDAYAPLFLWARAHAVRVVPINAEPGLARAVARGAVDTLSPEARAALPPLDSGHPDHRRRFDAWMAAAAAGHGGAPLAPEVLDRYYLAQLVWDETMAAHVAALLRTDPSVTVVVLAGVGHVAHGVGIPARVAAATGLPFVIVMPRHADARDAPPPSGAIPYPEREADLEWVLGP